MKWIFLLLFPLLAFSQDYEYYESLKKLSGEKLQVEVKAKIDNLDVDKLCGFLRGLKENKFDIKPYTSLILSKADEANYPLPLYCLTETLLELGAETISLQKSLSSMKNIWDNGNWSQKFWKLIRTHKLLVPEDEYYTVDENGNKHYKLDEYLADKISKGELGKNPLLQIDYSLLEYTSGQLRETLSKLDIQDLQVVPKSKSTGLFGSRGVDGMLKVLIRK